MTLNGESQRSTDSRANTTDSRANIEKARLQHKPRSGATNL